jgi:inorganic pyrophosphatase
MILESIEDVKQFLNNNNIVCKLERRPLKYMFGVNNYGEIPNTINPSDGDPWDIIIPGYPALDTRNSYLITKLEGAILMPNGNHKLIVNVSTHEYRKSNKHCRNEVFIYRGLYKKICKKYGHVVFY